MIGSYVNKSKYYIQIFVYWEILKRLILKMLGRIYPNRVPATQGVLSSNIFLNNLVTLTGSFCSSSKVRGIYRYSTRGGGHCLIWLIYPITIATIPMKDNKTIIDFMIEAYIYLGEIYFLDRCSRCSFTRSRSFFSNCFRRSSSALSIIICLRFRKKSSRSCSFSFFLAIKLSNAGIIVS